MKKFLTVVLSLVALSVMAGADVAEAKRLGGGSSFGAQRKVTPAPPAAPSATPSAPSPSAQAAPAKPVTPAPAASGASRWLGPLAGLAAGLGLAALMSHLGLSEGFGTILLIGLLVVGGIFLVRMLLARRTQAASPMQYAGIGIGSGAGAARQEPYVAPAAQSFEPVFGGAPAQPALAAPAGRFPPGFDPAPFVEQAKLQFRKLQSAYDAADRKALSEVMTPEMFTQVSGELAGRGAHTATEVMRLDAEVLEASTEDDRHWISVQFRGLLREDGTVLPKEFDEVWNLSKPVDGSTGWLLAGIQQLNEVA
jgi:predicted lipid-binding transport protein (Tim44 family)